MKITNIEIKNFRNYPNLNIEINNTTVILTGPNAVGKTNLLESVYFASLFKSFRDDTEFIFLKDASNLSLKLTLEKSGETRTLEIFLEKKEKIYANFMIDGVKKKRREAQGFMSVVIFDPTDVDMFTKTPESRRKYLNMVLSQKNLAYLDALGNYKKALLMKNRLLQDMKAGRSQGQDLAEWDDQLVSLGSYIILERKKFVNFLNTSVAEIYANISGFHRPVEVFYETLAGDTVEEIAENFRQKLSQVAAKEKMLATCLVGPHRDDFSLKSEGLYLSPFSSRGELRSQVLSLKILELEYLSHGDEKPILLLDDVLSELDETRRTFLLKYLQNRFQTFITTTHPLEMPAQHITLTPALEEEEVES
ncbi:MAG: DNA replication/repair protein RecF [Candidatus Doudnabacteria bacterium]|nr:DNA replication/repair protein RecF [Candidatus Doudnabacteria bacterium]